MSYPAYLDAIETKTGRTPQQLLGEAAERAFYGVLRNGPTVPEKHVGSSGSHRDEFLTLRLDGVAYR